jgi:hypothetical protein
MKITCISVPGGWQTLVYTTDGGEYPFGPVFNKVTDLWDWQRANLYNVATGYKLMEAA